MKLEDNIFKRTVSKLDFFPSLSLINTQACSQIRTKTPAEVQKELSWSAAGLVPVRGFDGDCGNTLLQNITFSCVCFKLLMLVHKESDPLSGCRHLNPLNKQFSGIWILGKTGWFEAFLVRCGLGALAVTYMCPSIISSARSSLLQESLVWANCFYRLCGPVKTVWISQQQSEVLV